MPGRTRAAKTAPAPEPEVVEEDGSTRGPSELHELFSQWLEEETDVRVSPEHIYLVTSKRTAFRKSDAYAEYRDGKDAVREEAKRAKEERKTARAAEASEDDEPKPAKRRGRTAPSEETEAPARPAGRRGRRAAAAEEAPADPTPITAGRRRGGRRATEPAF